MWIKHFSIECDGANNSNNAFTSGDTITGRIILQVSKKTRIQSLTIRAMGQANVSFSVGRTAIYSHETYYNVQRHILTDEVIGPGRHSFLFSFKIPDRDMPSSLKAISGKVVHQLWAQLKQPMSLSKNTKAKFTFEAKPDMTIPMLMEPQYGCKDQSVTFFASGKISLKIFLEKMGYRHGEKINVVARISNCSTRTVRPKFLLYVKESFLAQGRRREITYKIWEQKGEQVGSSCEQTVTKTIRISSLQRPSILNCSIIKLEYRLKVLLDVSLAKNPEVKLPIILLSCDGSGAE